MTISLLRAANTRAPDDRMLMLYLLNSVRGNAEISRSLETVSLNQTGPIDWVHVGSQLDRTLSRENNNMRKIYESRSYGDRSSTPRHGRRVNHLFEAIDTDEDTEFELMNKGRITQISHGGACKHNAPYHKRHSRSLLTAALP